MLENTHLRLCLPGYFSFSLAKMFNCCSTTRNDSRRCVGAEIFPLLIFSMSYIKIFWFGYFVRNSLNFSFCIVNHSMHTWHSPLNNPAARNSPTNQPNFPSSTSFFVVWKNKIKFLEELLSYLYHMLFPKFILIIWFCTAPLDNKHIFARFERALVCFYATNCL